MTSSAWPDGVTSIRYDFGSDVYVARDGQYAPWVVWDATPVRQGAMQVKAYALREEAFRIARGLVAARKLGCADRCPECGHKKNSSGCQGAHG